MTEAEWLHCTNPQTMLEYLQGKVGDRKLRLVACAACRKVWSLLHDRRSQDAIEVAERFADQSADDHTTTSERIEAESSARTAVAMAEDRWRDAEEGDIAASGVGYWATAATAASVMTKANRAATEAVSEAGMALAWIEHDELAVGIDHWSGMEIIGAPWPNLIREIVGNPFRCVSVAPDWLTPTVLALAQAVYDNRILPGGTLDNARLAVLADALEDAGCDNAYVLNHCRQPGEHYRGCWVVDLLLGKK